MTKPPAAMLALLLVAAPVAAQDRIDDRLALARVCASEIGFDASAHECAAIAAVLRARCSECRLVTSARAYSSRVFDPARRDERAYLAHLQADGREPAYWPRTITQRRNGVVRVAPHAPWSLFRARWLALLELAGRIVRGDIEHGCEVDPDHWGMALESSVDMQRATRAGWTRVDCGETRNAFWSVPRRAREEN